MKTTAILIVIALVALVLVAGCTSNQSGTDTTGDTSSDNTGDNMGTGDTTSVVDNTDFENALSDFANSMDTADDTNSDLGDFTTEDSNEPTT